MSKRSRLMIAVFSAIAFVALVAGPSPLTALAISVEEDGGSAPVESADAIVADDAMAPSDDSASDAVTTVDDEAAGQLAAQNEAPAETGALATQADLQALPGDALNGVAVLLRPAGSSSVLAVSQDGTSANGAVRLCRIGGSSRLHLQKAGDSSYKIGFYDSFAAASPYAGERRVLDLDGPSNKDGAAIQLSADGGAANQCWQLLRQDDGTYLIRNEWSGKYWSLKDADANKDNNGLCQSSTPMKWEMEVVSADDAKKAYDSYSLPDGGTGTTITSLNWMGGIPDASYLTDLTIPGAHDAGACNVGNQGRAQDFRSQQFYLDDLLNNGVRYFDLRLVMQDGKLVVAPAGNAAAGVCRNRKGDALTLDEAMGWVRAFLAQHPTEAVILQLADATDKGAASGDIYRYFRDLATAENSIVYAGNGAPTMADVRGKVVLISRIGEDKAGGSYASDRGTWAIYANWKEGADGRETAQAASTNDYEVWTQDKANLKASKKWAWIKGSLFGQDNKTGAKARHDAVLAGGKQAWVINGTGCASLGTPDYYPQVCARDVNTWLKQSSELGASAKAYLGIVSCDFVDEQLAQRLYAINFRAPTRSQPASRQVTFEQAEVQKSYGDAEFKQAASVEGDGAITYRSSDTNVATVDENGVVTIRGVGTALITAEVAATETYQQASGSYTLEVRSRVTFAGESATRGYTGAKHELTGVAVDGPLEQLGHTHNVTYAAAGTDAGSYQGTITAKENVVIKLGDVDVTPYYDVTVQNGTLTVTPVAAAITVNNASKVKGEADPAFSGTVKGLLKDSDLGTVSYRRTNTDEGAGTYKDVLDATYTPNKNYNVSVTKGTFTIKALLTVRWLDGDGSVLWSETYVEGDPVPTFGGDTPTKAPLGSTFYTFEQWDGGTVDGDTTTYLPIFSEESVEDEPQEQGESQEQGGTTAQGSPAPQPAGRSTKATLTFDLGGGTFEGRTSLTIEANVGDVITIPEAPVRKGYTFSYWKGSEYHPGDRYEVTGNHRFTAVWVKGNAKAPATGDASLPTSAAMAAAALGAAALLAARRRA